MIEILHVVVHFQHVVDDAAINGLLEKMLRLENHVIAPFDAFFVGIPYELVNNTLLAQMLFQLGSVFVSIELLSVVVRIFNGESPDFCFPEK